MLRVLERGHRSPVPLGVEAREIEALHLRGRLDRRFVERTGEEARVHPLEVTLFRRGQRRASAAGRAFACIGMGCSTTTTRRSAP